MSSVTNVDTLNALGLTQNAQTAKPNNQLGQADFMKLMTTQLQNQDPTKPMDNSQFIAQMAQFAQVSATQGLQTSFNTFVDSMSSNQALMAGGLVGHSVLVPSQIGVLPANGRLTGTISLANSTNSLNLGIYDSTGQLVQQMDLGQQASGEVGFVWDGTTNAGTKAPPGQYVLKAIANVDGKPQQVDTSVVGAVSSVNINNTDKTLKLSVSGMGEFALTTVKQIM